MKNKPFPNLIDGRRWRITPHNGIGGWSDLRGAQMSVPEGQGHVETIIRNHEMAHARWSPLDIPKLGHPLADMARQWVEDVRIETLGDSVDVQTSTCRLGKCVECAVEMDKFHNELKSTFETHGVPTTGVDIAVHFLTGLDKAKLIGVTNRVTATAVSELKKLVISSPYNLFVANVVARRLAKLIDPSIVFDDEEDERPPEEKIDTTRGVDKAVIWGINSIRQLSLVDGTPTKAVTIPSYEGTVPRRMDRLLTDNMVFTRRKRIKRSSVLIDVSASMKWTYEALLDLLNSIPAATVAVYGSVTPGRGQTIIIAKDGMRGSQRDIEAVSSMQGNAVDGPALDWLGTQSEPRFWLSDGYVTDSREAFDARILHDAMGKVGRYRVKWVTTTEELFSELAKVK